MLSVLVALYDGKPPAIGRLSSERVTTVNKQLCVTWGAIIRRKCNYVHRYYLCFCDIVAPLITSVYELQKAIGHDLYYRNNTKQNKKI